MKSLLPIAIALSLFGCAETAPEPTYSTPHNDSRYPYSPEAASTTSDSARVSRSDVYKSGKGTTVFERERSSPAIAPRPPPRNASPPRSASSPRGPHPGRH